MAAFKRRKTHGDAIAKCEQSHTKWADKLGTYYRARKLSKRSVKRIETLLGLRPYGGPIKASDLAAGRMLSRILVDVVHEFQRAVPGSRWFHVTLLADEFILNERRPILLLKRLKGKAYKEIRELGLDGIIMLDTSPLPNHPQGGEGGSFLVHVHCLCKTEKPFDLRRARRTLAGSRSWSCKLGADPAHIVEITRELGDPSYWAAYGSKPAYEAKNRVEKEGKVKLMATEEGYRGHFAMRLVEGLSQLALRDTVQSVGESKDLRDEVMRRLARWHRSRWVDQRPTKPFSVKRLWKRFWKASRVRKYRSWSIHGSTL